MNTIKQPSAELNELISRLRNLRCEVAALEAEEETIKDLVKEQLSNQQADTILGADYKVTWKDVISARVDTKALRAAEPDLVAQYTRTSTYKRFDLK